MGGGLMQLVAYGAQDIYLTGNPQITFFKVVYRRHTNFAMESIEQTINGSVGTGESSVSATISRNGDLVGALYLEAKLTGSTSVITANAGYANWTNNTGHAYLKECSVEIGGQEIDKHTSEWLDIYNELTDHSESEWVGLNKHVAKNAYLKSNTAAAIPNNLKVYVPLQFWFCRNPGLALPLIALQYHEVKVKMTLRAELALVNSDASTVGTVNGTNPTTKLWADYYYLDTDERRRFAQVSHEYLIEQLQYISATFSSNQKLNFNHPIKELVWVIRDTTAGTESTGTSTNNDATANTAGGTMAAANDYFNYAANDQSQSEVNGTVTNYTMFSGAKLQLNGHDRMAERTPGYFNFVQPKQAGHRVPSKHIYVYSFALKPEEHQPSGTCNFSRIDTAYLKFTNADTTTAANLYVYAVNYNVLRVMSGMGGLAYSN